MNGKKKGFAILLAALLGISGTALAETTSISVDGKTYQVSGSVTRFEADGKTFVIGENTVTVQEAGKADRVLPMDTETDDSVEYIAEGAYSTAPWGASLESGDEDALVYRLEPLEGSDTDAQVFITTPADSVEYSVESVATLSDDITFTCYDSADGDTADTAASYAVYAPYGLRFDEQTQKLYYHDTPVRVFTDAFEMDSATATVREYYNPEGLVDVETIRKESEFAPAQQENIEVLVDGVWLQSAGEVRSCELVGLRQLTQEEFDARDVSELGEVAFFSADTLIPSDDAEVAGCVENAPMTAEEWQALFAEYAPFGLVYDAQTETLRFDGMEVKEFLDVRTESGETITHFANATGEVRVETVRDYTQADENGEGQLIGLQFTLIGE